MFSHVKRQTAISNNKSAHVQSVASWPWTFKVSEGAHNVWIAHLIQKHQHYTLKNDHKTIAELRMHTHNRRHRRTPWQRWWKLLTPCCVWSGVPGVGTARRASRSAASASLPAPDNFTIPALAGGDNHIRLPWQDALNSAPVPLRVWHPAVCRRACCWRYNEVCVFIFQVNDTFFFCSFYVFSFLVATASEMYLGSIRDPTLLWRKSELAVCCRHCPVKCVIVEFVMANSIHCQAFVVIHKELYPFYRFLDMSFR